MTFRIGTLALLVALPLGSAYASSLGGSPSSMRRQHLIAVKNHFTFLRTAAQVREFVRADRLERLEPSADLDLANVSFPYARPAVVLFAERLAFQFREANGDRLVVTSLTRPLSRQPANAHRLSVHPTGMAVDLRVPADAAGRRWLERTLLQLESSGVLDATRERHPAHYHVAVFPEKYADYVERLTGDDLQAALATADASSGPAPVDTVTASLEPGSAEPTEDEIDALGDAATAPADPEVPRPIIALGTVLGLTAIAGAGAVAHRRDR